MIYVKIYKNSWVRIVYLANRTQGIFYISNLLLIFITLSLLALRDVIEEVVGTSLCRPIPVCPCKSVHYVKVYPLYLFGTESRQTPPPKLPLSPLLM